MRLRSWTAGVALLLLLFASGCGSRDGVIVLRVGNWGGASDGSEASRKIDSLYRLFEKENPGVKIQLESIPGSQEYVNKMILNFIAGTEPDVMALDASSAAVFIDNGVLMDLAPMVAKDKAFSLNDYFPNVVDIARRGKKLYAVPTDFTPIVMFYDKRLFDEAGVPYPKSGWTYDDFLKTAQQLTKGGRYGFKFTNWMPGWITWIWNEGGDDLDPSGSTASGYLDGAKSKDALQFLKDLIDVHKVAPSLSQAAGLGVDMFTNGEAAMEVNGHWAMIGYAAAPKDAHGRPLLSMKDVGVVELPTQLPHSVTVMYEAGMAIGKNCKHPDIAWKYIKFMSSARIQRIANSTGIAISARKDVAAEHAANDPREREFLRIVPSARAPWGASVEGYDNVETVGQKMMDNVLQGGLTLEEALRRAVDEIDEDFKKR